MVANTNRTTAAATALSMRTNDGLIAFGGGAYNIARGLWDGALAPWTAFTTDNGSVCYRIGAGVGGLASIASLFVGVGQATAAARAGAVTGRHVAAGGGRVFTSPDPYVGEMATLIDRVFPGKVVDVNSKNYYMANGKKREIDIDLGNLLVQVKSGNAKKLIKQIRQTMETTGRPVIGYAPKMKPNAVRDAARQGLRIATTPSELLRLVREFG